MAPVSILLVEDNEDILANLYAYLEPLGYELDCARNGRTGLEMAASGQFDLVVLGFVGPGVSPTLTRAADVLDAWDDAPCVLEGHILEKIPRKDRYLFEDESGRVVVEIEHGIFGHLTVTPQDKVRLVGHVDWSAKHPNEVEVDALAIIP